MEDTRIPKKVFKAKFEGVSSVGKSRERWEDAVQRDAARVLRRRNWKLAANDRILWRQKIEEVKARFWAVAPLDGWSLYSETDKSIPHLPTFS
jgi:hypothetical protein